jgi:nucleoside-diphosphate-sugar epimerase
MVAATHPAAEGEAFNCAVDPPPTAKEYVHAYGKLTGNDSWIGLPMPIVRTLSWLAVPFAKKRTYARQLPQNLAFVDSYVTYPVAKAKRLLGWEPAVDVDEGIRRSIPWLRENGYMDDEEAAGE